MYERVLEVLEGLKRGDLIIFKWLDASYSTVKRLRVPLPNRVVETRIENEQGTFLGVQIGKFSRMEHLTYLAYKTDGPKGWIYKIGSVPLPLVYNAVALEPKTGRRTGILLLEAPNPKTRTKKTQCFSDGTVKFYRSRRVKEVE